MKKQSIKIDRNDLPLTKVKIIETIQNLLDSGAKNVRIKISKSDQFDLSIVGKESDFEIIHQNNDPEWVEGIAVIEFTD